MADKTKIFETNYSLSRRQFLGKCTACAAGLSVISVNNSLFAALPAIALPKEKAKVRLVFTHISPEKPCWPYIGFDFKGRKKELLGKLQRSCPDIEFMPATAMSPAQASKILEKDNDIDGYVVYLLGHWTGWLDNAPMTIAQAGEPTVFVDDTYGGSGEFLSSYALAKRKKLKVTGVASSDFDDVAEAVNCLACLKKMQCSTILEIGSSDKWWGHIPAKTVKEHFGPNVISISHQQLAQAYNNTNSAEAKKQAKKWISKAEKIIEPSRADVEKSARMHAAILNLMAKHNAQAVTINCLEGFADGTLKAYPCLSFFQLDNDGFVGACEADMYSTVTKLIGAYLKGRPGYISDPVIDTAKNQVIYAHCVAPNKVFGPDGPANSYHIRSHSSDLKGASIRSLMPLGKMTTSIRFDPRKKQVIFHQGKTVANIDDKKACRTKLAVEVKGDINKLFDHWDKWGWHRVTFYGDLKQPVRHIAALLGYEMLEEA